MTTSLAASILAAMLACAAAPSDRDVAAIHPAYRVEAIAPDANGTGDARAVDAAGDVAGEYDGAAFVWRAGRFTKIPPVRSFYLGDEYSSVATSINDRGVAVGEDGEYTPCSMSGMELVSAVRFESGRMHFLDPSKNGFCNYEASGINDRGTIVGVSQYRGFVRTPNGVETEIRPLSTRPEFNGTRATAVDNENVVVGGTTIDVPNVPMVRMGEQTVRGGRAEPVYGPDSRRYAIHAFLLPFDGSEQHMRDLGAIFGYPDTFATALNEDGIVVGYSGDESGPKWTRVSGPSHAWVWQRGHMTDLGSLRSIDSFAYGVNDAATIVGCSGGDAVRWVDKHMQDLNGLIDPRSGWHLTCARAINRSGVIVGEGSLRGHGPLPVRLVPVEPSQPS